MLCEINKDESSAALRKVPVYLVDPGGNPYTASLSGFTITFRKPGGAHVDKTSVFASLGNGEYEMALTSGDVDTAGNGWVKVEKAGTILTFDDFVRIKTDTNAIIALLPTALDGGFIKARLDSAQLPDIASAVWEEAIAGHLTSGSFGELLRKVAGLSKHNVRIDNITFDAAHLLTVGRLRCFDSAAHAAASTPGNVGTETGELFRFPIAATSTGSGEFSTWLMTET